MTTIITDTRFQPIGHCIYCGSAEPPLSDEHIVPFSLEGQLILPQASCRACAKITGRFERDCARSIFGQARIRIGMRTRRKKERPTHLPLYNKTEKGLVEAIQVPVEEYPSSIALMKFTTPRIILGLPDDGASTMTNEIWTATHKHQVTEKYGPGLHHKMRFNPLSFSRLLAKIAHSWLTASRVVVFRPLLVDLILGRSSNQGYLIGGLNSLQTPADETRNLHELEARTVCDGRFIAVSVRLFAPLGTPVYCAIVGEL